MFLPRMRWPFGSGVCDNGINCMTITCQKEHPHGRRQPCRNAFGCNRPDCPFLHNPRQQRCYWERVSPVGMCWRKATNRECPLLHQLTNEDYEFIAFEARGKCCHGPSKECRKFRRSCRLTEEQHRDYSAALIARFPEFGPPRQCHWEEASPARICWRRVGELLCGNLHTRSDEDYAFITLHTKKQKKCYHGPSLRCKPTCLQPEKDHRNYSAELCARFPEYAEQKDPDPAAETDADADADADAAAKADPAAVPVREPMNGNTGEGEVIEDDHSCCICLDGPPTHIILDCMHLCLCGGCTEGLKNCPKCRAPVLAIKRVFM